MKIRHLAGSWVLFTGSELNQSSDLRSGEDFFKLQTAYACWQALHSSWDHLGGFFDMVQVMTGFGGFIRLFMSPVLFLRQLFCDFSSFLIGLGLHWHAESGNTDRTSLHVIGWISWFKHRKGQFSFTTDVFYIFSRTIVSMVVTLKFTNFFAYVYISYAYVHTHKIKKIYI